MLSPQALYGQSAEDTNRHKLKISSSGRIPIIQYAHLAVHEDGFVTASEYVADLDIASPRIYYIKPLSGYELHSNFLIQCSAPCRVQLYESPTVTGDGTRLVHMRHQRKSSVADNARDTTFHTPTVTNPPTGYGTKIHDVHTGGTINNPANRIGGQTRQGEEIVLNPLKGYILTVTATVNDTVMSISHEYYEVKI